MIYGYARVSTTGQARNGNSLEEQMSRLKERGATAIFTDAYTGTKANRPELDKLLSVIQPGDTLMVCKMDRLSRSVIQGTELVNGLLAKGIIVHILNMGVMDSTPTGKLIRSIMLAFAEFERDMIVERTGEGKEVKRLTDPTWKEGRKCLERESVDEYVKMFRNGEKTVKECCAELGVSRSWWYNRLKSAS